MLIFWRLLLGHLLADFTFQTNFINRWKRSSFGGMMVHCAMHPLFYCLLTFPYLRDIWVQWSFIKLQGWACILIIFLAHFLEDQWRVWTISRHHTPDNTLYFIWDQMIHYGVLWAVSPMSDWGMGVDLIPEKWPVLACLFIIVTHTCTVLIYFVEKDFSNRVFPGFEEKYLTMLERLVLALCFFVPGHIFVLPVLGWLSVMHYIRSKKILDLSWLSLYLGGVITIACGFAGRFIYYY